MKDKPTIQDVANESNVSTATVSRVINGKTNVTEATKKRVQEAIDKLGFEIRRSDLLSDVDSKTILVCVTELKNPFNVPVLDGIQSALYKHGYDLLILQTKEYYTTYTDYESVLKSQKFAGVIFLSSVTNKQLQEITNLLNYKVPIVCCSEYVEDMDIPYVAIDDQEAMYKSTEYILSLGKRKIAFLNASLKHKYAKNRDIGFRKAMNEHSIPINEDFIFNLSSVSYNLAYSNTLHLLNLDEIPDAIVCAADVYAMGAINACRKKGIHVPNEMAIIGFDNLDLATMCYPALTTIDQPCFNLGYQASELLIEKIFNSNIPTRRIFLDTQLIVRESTPIIID